MMTHDPAQAIRSMRDALTTNWGFQTSTRHTEEMRLTQAVDGFGVAFGYATGQINVKILRGRAWIAKESWPVGQVDLSAFLSLVHSWMVAEDAIPHPNGFTVVFPAAEGEWPAEGQPVR